jgi:hypothetical protein
MAMQVVYKSSNQWISVSGIRAFLEISMVYTSWKHKTAKIFYIYILQISIKFIKFCYTHANLPNSMPLQITIRKLGAEIYNLLPVADGLCQVSYLIPKFQKKFSPGIYCTLLVGGLHQWSIFIG